MTPQLQAVNSYLFIFLFIVSSFQSHKISTITELNNIFNKKIIATIIIHLYLLFRKLLLNILSIEIISFLLFLNIIYMLLLKAIGKHLVQ